MKISLEGINYKGYHFEKVNFETDEKNLTEAEIIEKAKEFLDGIIEKEKMK